MSPHLKRPTPAPYFHPLHLIFHIPPPPEEVFKIYSPSPSPFKKVDYQTILMVSLLQATVTLAKLKTFRLKEVSLTVHYYYVTNHLHCLLRVLFQGVLVYVHKFCNDQEYL